MATAYQSSNGPGEICLDRTTDLVSVNGKVVVWLILQEPTHVLCDPENFLSNNGYNIVISDRPEPNENLHKNLIVRNAEEAKKLEETIGFPADNIVDKIRNVSFKRMS